MISPSEYMRLYCDDTLAKQGIPALSLEKIARQMSINPHKTLQDLEDYGLSEAMEQNGISDVNMMNLQSGEVQRISGGPQGYQRTPTPLIDSLLK